MSYESLRKPFFTTPENTWAGNLRRHTSEYRRATQVDSCLALGQFAAAEAEVATLAAGNRIHHSTLNTYLSIPMQQLATENTHETLATVAKQYYKEEISPVLQDSELLETFRAAEASYGEYGTLLEDLTAKIHEASHKSKPIDYLTGAISETAILALLARAATHDLQAIGEGEGDIDQLVLPYSASHDQDHGGKLATDIMVQTSGAEIPIQVKTTLEREHYKEYNSRHVLLIGLNQVSAGHHPITNHRLINTMLHELAGERIPNNDEQYLRKSAKRLKKKIYNFQISKQQRRRVSSR